MELAAFFFFFQAEDGIRDATVTGVQTCALPICPEAAADGRRQNSNGAFRQAENRGDILAIRVRCLRTRLDFDAVADAPGESRFGFDASMLDESGFHLDRNNYIGLLQTGFHVTANNAAADQNVVRTAGMYTRRAGREGGINRHERGQFFPRDSKTAWIEILECLRIADNCSDGFAAKTNFFLRENGLIGAIGNHTVAVPARHVLCSENGVNARVRGNKSIEVAKGES